MDTSQQLSVNTSGLSDSSNPDNLSPSDNQYIYRSPSPCSTSSRFSSAKSQESFGYDGRSSADYGRFYTRSYLQSDGTPADVYKRGPPLTPKSKAKSPHYHRPENFSYRNVRSDIAKPIKKGSMLTVLADSTKLNRILPSPKNSEEAIRLAKYPDGHEPEGKAPSRIERPDWPAPPSIAAAYPELLRERPRRRSRGGASDTEDNGIVEELEEEEEEQRVDPQVEKEIEELSKHADSAMSQVIMKDLEKKRIQIAEQKLDPRSASRTPSASKEPHYKTRYESPVYASPSRFLDQRPRLHSMDDELMSKKYRSQLSPIGNFPVPKPGYGLSPRSSTLPNSTRDGRFSSLGDFTFENEHTNGTHNGDEEGGRLASASSEPEIDPQTGLRRSSRYRSTSSQEVYYHPAYRRSVPVKLHPAEEPPQIYSVEQLLITNPELPKGVDRNFVEIHLSREDFLGIFGMSRQQFYRLAEWKRNDIKRKMGLF